MLIVGGGPVGLITALLLARAGLESLVVEKHTGLHRMPQAHVISSRTMEICRLAGVDEARMRAEATPPQDMGYVRWVDTLLGHDLGAFAMLRDRGEARAMLTQSPTPMCNLSQHLFEPILLDQIRSTPETDVRFNHTWRAFERTDQGVRSLVDGPQGTTHITSRYLIGADGAASAVRNALDIAMVGPDSLARFYNIHVTMDLRAALKDREAILYWVMDPEYAGVFIAHNIDHTWVYMKALHPGAEQYQDLDEAACRRLLAGALGGEVEFTVDNVSPWTMTAQIADSYGGAGVFLVGDAAHRFPPTGGIGMNTGFADAHNLAWKIALVERGWPAVLLDSYETERRPVAQTNSEQSTRNHLKMAEVARAIGLGRDPEASRQAIAHVVADEDHRRRVQRAIDDQVEHFNMTGLDLGVCYASAAVIGDGLPPQPDNLVTHYHPSTTPGARLPHAWVTVAGERRSTLDLLDYSTFTLLHDPQDVAAATAAAQLAAAGHPLRAVPIGADGIATPADAAFAALFELRQQPLLVRPDGHIAWRGRAPYDASELAVQWSPLWSGQVVSTV